MTSSSGNYSTVPQASSNHSGVSWGAIFAGAAGAAALSLILMVAGFGLGFSAVSPWADSGVTAKTLAVSTIVWLIFTQIVASGLGGYIAGRLRVKWSTMHTDEVYFRDTAHGFLAWAVATLVVAGLIISSAANVIGSGAQAGASMASGAASAATQVAGNAASSSTGDDGGYFVDSLFRNDQPSATSDDAAHGVVFRIFSKSIANNGQLSADDRTYLAQVVAQRTNLSQADAQARVDQVYGQAVKAVNDAKTAAKNAADAAAKAAAWASLWMFIALLCGAFCASLAATYGGRRRDAVVFLRETALEHDRETYTSATNLPPVR